MRIAIVIHAESPFGQQYGRIFKERGHQVEMFSLSAYSGASPDVPVRVVGPRDFKPWKSSKRLVPYLKTVGPLRRALKKFAPDIVFANYLSSGGLLACAAGHPRIVLSAIGSDVVSNTRSRVWRAIYAWEIRKARLVHVVSEPLVGLLHERAGMGLDKCLVAPVGVDTTLLRLTELAQRPNNGQIICTRGHKPVYGQETVVKAVARLKHRGVACRLLFTHAMNPQSTRDCVRQQGVEDIVNFRDGYKYEELPAILGGADVYVSASFSDGMSNSLLEAMSTGTFPVVSDIVANTSWVEHGRTGLLFPPGDDAALAERLEEALAKPQLRGDAALINRKIAVERGDMYTQADRLLEAFERIVHS